MFEFLYYWKDSLRNYLICKLRQILIDIGPSAGLTVSAGPKLEYASLYDTDFEFLESSDDEALEL